MKSAKPAAAADSASSQRRSQPVRQTRTNPPRSSLHAGRAGGPRESHSSAPVGDQPIDIFPAITHFADTITALPKELVRHFTLLKEVDAKIFAPQEQLFKLVSAATAPAPAPATDTQHANDASSTIAPTSAPMSAQGSSSGFGANPSMPSSLAGDPNAASSGVFDPSNIPRRQLFRQTAFKIQEMLVSLEEKNHVISTANEALQRQLSRIEDVWPHLENEFSDEAKWGSATHWAYPENRGGRSYPENARRAGAAAISAAAQALADEAAARSDARKQAVQAKRNLKNGNVDSDMDDKPQKKSAKARRAADADNVGLGISGSANGNPQKRRKTEKTATGGTAMERTASSALGSASGKGKTNSPRSTPAPDGAKKRRALPTASGQAKKKTAAATGKSPSVTSSPVMGAFPDPKAAASPNLTSAPRPASSRARQNSVGSGPENGKPRPPAVANKPNGSTPPTTEPASSENDKKAVKEPSAAIKTEPGKKAPEQNNGGPTSAPTRRDSKAEETEVKNEAQSLPQPATVTTKSGRASKPSTPALATFQEAAAQRQSRARDNGGSKKKKTVSTTAQALAQQATDTDGNSSMQGDDEDGEIDADEPTYCYCNSVSYGEMVACDSDDCEREWFHLACVGLKVAPGSKTKWYCEDCKERLKLAGKKVNSR